MTPKIVVENLSITWNQQVLLEVPRWEAYQGQVHAIIGESGSGKSLLLKHLLGFLPDTLQCKSSSILHLQHQDLSLPLKKASQWQSLRGKHIAMVFQDPLSALNPQMTCGQQLWEAWRVHAPKSLHHDADQIRERLDDVGLGTMYQRVMESFPHQLSGGQRQRVVIAMATLHLPEIILADEPTTALDYFSRKQVLTDLVNVVKKLNSTLIWVTHELDVVEAFADKVMVLRQGAFIQSGTVKEVFFDSPADYVKELLEALPAPKKQHIPDNKPDIQIIDLSKRYPNGVKALQEFSIQLSYGQTLAVIGTSGSGKSTLAKLLTALERPTSGSISVMGKPLSSLPPTGIQMVFQDPFASLNKQQTALEAMLEVAKVCFPKENNDRRRKMVEQGFLEVGLGDNLWNKRPAALSGGQRQRLAIAKALLSNPSMLILDEAVAALDPLVQKQVLNLLRKVQKERKLIFLFITHDLAVAASMADKMVFLQAGEVKEIPQEWLDHMPS